MAGTVPDTTRSLDEVTEAFSVLVVDDHEVALWGFEQLLSTIPWIDKIYTAGGPDQALQTLSNVSPDVAIIDLYLGRESGLNLCRQIRDICPETRILLISGAAHVSEGVARGAGASGFVGKEWSNVEIGHAIRVIARGGKIFADAPLHSSPRADLSERELEVLQHVAEGLSNKEIAEKLSLSVNTVKDYVERVFRKLRARNRADAVAKAQRLGLVN